MKSIKQKIFELLDKRGYVLDRDVAVIYGDKDLNFITAEEYKRQWKRLMNDREFFADKEIKEIKKHRRLHVVELVDGTCYRCGKDYYLENIK